MKLHQLIALVRQWTFPPEFRIAASRDGAGVTALLAQTLQALVAVEPPSPPPAADGLGAAPTVVDLCNGLFRLRRSAGAMEAQGMDCRELRNIRRALENVDALLNKHGIEYRDLADQVYDDGRTDFDPLATEEQAGLDVKRIGLCERPAVWFEKRLVQAAKGIVVVPARSTSLT